MVAPEGCADECDRKLTDRNRLVRRLRGCRRNRAGPERRHRRSDQPAVESNFELRRSIELSPNFALGHYTLGFVEAQSGDPRVAIEATNTSRELSPFDPLQFGMLGSRAVAHMRLGELDEAAVWALKAIGRPNAHVHILAIAASALSLTHRYEEARALVARIRKASASYDLERFLRAFRFDRETESLLRASAKAIGVEG